MFSVFCATPTLDMQGHDAPHKITIIAAHAYGELVDVKEVRRLGVASVTAEDIVVARRLALASGLWHMQSIMRYSNSKYRCCRPAYGLIASCILCRTSLAMCLLP